MKIDLKLVFLGLVILCLVSEIQGDETSTSQDGSRSQPVKSGRRYRPGISRTRRSNVGGSGKVGAYRTGGGGGRAKGGVKVKGGGRVRGSRRRYRKGRRYGGRVRRYRKERRYGRVRRYNKGRRYRRVRRYRKGRRYRRVRRYCRSSGNGRVRCYGRRYHRVRVHAKLGLINGLLGGYRRGRRYRRVGGYRKGGRYRSKTIFPVYVKAKASLYKSKVIRVELVKRPVKGYLGKLGVKLTGVVVTTKSGKRWLICKRKGYGASGQTVVVNAKVMSKKWKIVKYKKVTGAKVGDYVKTGGKKYRVPTDNCNEASRRFKG